MKSIKEKFSLLNIMEMLKNGDVTVSLLLLHVTCILLLIVQDSVTNDISLNTVTCFVLLKRTPKYLINIHAATLKLFIFTPRELNYRLTNVLILLIFNLLYSFQLFTIPVNLIFFNKVWSQLTVVLSWGFILYSYYGIKKIFCPPKFKRIYVFMVLDILTSIFKL